MTSVSNIRKLYEKAVYVLVHKTHETCTMMRQTQWRTLKKFASLQGKIGCKAQVDVTKTIIIKLGPLSLSNLYI